MPDVDWRALNRANWDEGVPNHLAAPIYDPVPLRAGLARKNAIEEAELGSADGLHLVHLQCHFDRGTLILAQRGATVVGLDFSPPALAAARSLAEELGLADRARFVEADLHDAPKAIPETASFDRVYVTWGAICWLPDIAGWARIVALFLKPGGALYLAEGHPAALAFDDTVPQPDGRRGFFVPYFRSEPLMFDEATDCADPDARLTKPRTCQWIHPLGTVVTAQISAGLHRDWLHEHDAITWRMFTCLIEGPDGLFRWPDRPWLPLAYSLQATRA
jgi:SAM-dependent methyltransferase